jgi:hypothetical protein
VGLPSFPLYSLLIHLPKFNNTQHGQLPDFVTTNFLLYIWFSIKQIIYPQKITFYSFFFNYCLDTNIWRPYAEMVEMLLEWNKCLASEVDSNGSTPLHFVSSRLEVIRVRRTFFSFPVPRPSPWPTQMLLEANPAALYQPDNRGMFPIHVAASVNEDSTVARFIRCDPSCAGLRDRRGRTFLHTAAENSKYGTVIFGCRTPSLAWILNMQDADGNTALHLATQAGCLQSFASLLGNHQVHLNLANRKGQTQRDISQLNFPLGFYHGLVNLSSHSFKYLKCHLFLCTAEMKYIQCRLLVSHNNSSTTLQSTPAMIHAALYMCDARYGSCRWDHIRETYDANINVHDFERKELEKLKDSTQTLGIGSVLIATVTFGATFALPGGYRADDHTWEVFFRCIHDSHRIGL